jgi:hypothetical protein
MTLDIQANPPAAEVQIHCCRYDVVCRAQSCRAPAAFISVLGQGTQMLAKKPSTREMLHAAINFSSLSPRVSKEPL